MRRITKTTMKTALAVFMSTVAFAGIATSANAATGADGFTIIHASAGDAVHHCIKAGSDSYGDEAIICVDINTKTWYDPQDGEYWGEAQSQLEAYCQNDGVIGQCEGITMAGEYANALDSYTYGSSCGTVNEGACPVGRKYAYSNWYLTSPNYNCGSTADTVANVWSLARAIKTQWVLPTSGITITLDYGSNGNYSSGHYYVCY